MNTALLVEDDPSTLEQLDVWIQQRRFGTRLARNLTDARGVLESEHVDLAIVDVHLPDGSGLELHSDVPSHTPLVFVSGDTSFEHTRQALRVGALDYLSKPLDLDRLGEILETRRRQSNLDPIHDVPSLGPFVGDSPAMRRAYHALCCVADDEDTVFVHGETGTGKEVAARLVHARSSRASGPFEAINCGALAPSLAESELFGHERGSFTGAERKREGLFERASGGTVFLDEITEMPLDLQVRLLRVLESRQVTRVGGSTPVPFDVRVVTASNRPPAGVVSSGRMREDLFYRLHVLPVELPPLRDREEDILHIARYFLARWSEENNTATKVLSGDAVERLLEHDWPGNVRELKNSIRRAFVLSGTEIRADHFEFLQSRDRFDPYRIEVGLSLEEAERRLILATLRKFNGDKVQTAKTLGISLRTIYNRLHRYASRGDELLPPDTIRTRRPL